MSRPKLPCGHDESPYGYPCPCEEPWLYPEGDKLAPPTKWEYSDPNPPVREGETPPYGIPSLDPGLAPDFDPDPWASDVIELHRGLLAEKYNIPRDKILWCDRNKYFYSTELYLCSNISVSCKFTV